MTRRTRAAVAALAIAVAIGATPGAVPAARTSAGGQWRTLDPERNHDRHFWPRARILEYASQAGYDLVKIVDDPVEHMFVILKPRPS